MKIKRILSSLLVAVTLLSFSAFSVSAEEIPESITSEKVEDIPESITSEKVEDIPESITSEKVDTLQEDTSITAALGCLHIGFIDGDSLSSWRRTGQFLCHLLNGVWHCSEEWSRDCFCKACGAYKSTDYEWRAKTTPCLH